MQNVTVEVQVLFESLPLPPVFAETVEVKNIICIVCPYFNPLHVYICIYLTISQEWDPALAQYLIICECHV